MEKSFDGQYDDETVELVFNQHPVVLRKALVHSLLILVIAMVPFGFWPTHSWSLWVLIVGGLLAFLRFAYSWVSWHFSVYIVTNQRVININQKGLFNRQVVELRHEKVQNVNYEIKGIQASLFKYGTIVIQTFVGDLVIDTIHHPEKIHQQLSHIIRENNQEMGDEDNEP